MCSSDLGWTLGVLHEDTVPVGVERKRQPQGPHGPLEHLEVARGILVLAEQRRGQPPGRVVDPPPMSVSLGPRPSSQSWTDPSA